MSMEQSGSYPFQSVIELSTNKLWGAHFAVPNLVVQALSGDGEERRVVCTLNNQLSYQCAMLPRGDGSYLITVNKKIREQLHLEAGSRVQVSLQKDDSDYGLPMTEELKEVLAQDPEGDRLFHALTPGKLRTLLYIAAQIKSPDKRIARAFVIVNHLKENAGKIDYKKLHLELRERPE